MMLDIKHIYSEFLLWHYRNNLPFLLEGKYVRVIKYYVKQKTNNKKRYTMFFLLSNGDMIIKKNKKLKGILEV